MPEPVIRQVLPGSSGVNWQPWGTYEDVLLDRCDEGIARLAINRPTKRNAFRPRTVSELCDAFARIRDDSRIGVVLLTGVGPAADGGYAFCSGGDQSVRGDGGYLDETGLPRLNVLDLQRIIRSLPKVVIALVAGYAIGGGQVLHLLCDLSLAAENAVFGQTGPRVGSFDGGFGAGYLARVVGQRKAKEIWFLCRQYGADEALGMGLVNAVVPLRGSRGRRGALGQRGAATQPNGDSLPQSSVQCRNRWLSWHPGIGRTGHPPLLSNRRGPGGPQCLPGEAQSRFFRHPMAALATKVAKKRKLLRPFGCGFKSVLS